MRLKLPMFTLILFALISGAILLGGILPLRAQDVAPDRDDNKTFQEKLTGRVVDGKEDQIITLVIENRPDSQ